VAIGGLLTVALASFGSHASRGADIRKPWAERGRALAYALCRNCHVVIDGQAPTQDGIPAFRTIANKPGQSKSHIVQILTHPHPPMPTPPITVPDMTDIIAYLDTLRAAGSPPLLQPDGTDGPRNTNPG
jgi:hypothetical protein